MMYERSRSCRFVSIVTIAIAIAISTNNIAGKCSLSRHNLTWKDLYNFCIFTLLIECLLPKQNESSQDTKENLFIQTSATPSLTSAIENHAVMTEIYVITESFTTSSTTISSSTSAPILQTNSAPSHVTTAEPTNSPSNYSDIETQNQTSFIQMNATDSPQKNEEEKTTTATTEKPAIVTFEQSKLDDDKDQEKITFTKISGDSTARSGEVEATQQPGGGYEGEKMQKVQGTNYLAEKSLHEVLFSNYNKNVRPSQFQNEPITVEFDMKLQRIVGYDVKQQILTITAFNRMKWEDPQLQWNPSDYNGTNHINTDSSMLWTPDIVLFNTALETSKDHTDMYKTKVWMTHTGLLIWVAPVTWKVSCSSDITWFPVDDQTCSFNFGSWSYSKDQIRVKLMKTPGRQKKSEVLSDVFLVESGEWSLVSMTSFEEDLTFNCCPQPFSTIGFEMTLQRLSTYYFMYIIIPLMSLAFLFLLIFHIPHDAGERMGFGITVLLSITVYLLVVSEKLPEQSDSTPMLGICFMVIFYTLCFGLAVVTYTTLLAKRKHKPPKILMRIANNGGLLFCATKSSPVTPLDGSETPDSIKKMKNFGQDDGDERDYSQEWEKIGRYIDKRLFMVLSMILLGVPVITVIVMPKPDYEVWD